MARKSPLDHLDPARTPKLITMIPPGAPGHREAAGGTMIVSTPHEVDQLIATLRPGQLVTLDDLRRALARRHGATIACPVSTAIFANMAARAAEYAHAHGASLADITPWWRVLKNGGVLNPKLPGGTALQAERLEAEGIRISPLRRQPAVFDHEQRRPDWAR